MGRVPAGFEHLAFESLDFSGEDPELVPTLADVLEEGLDVVLSERFGCVHRCAFYAP